MTTNFLEFWRASEDDPFGPLYQTAPILMHSIDANGYLQQVSNFWATKLGYKPAEMVGRKSTDFLTEESRRTALEKHLPAFFETGAAYNVEYDFVKKNGKVVSVLMSAVAQHDSEGNFLRSLAIMFDNSESRRIAEELRHNQRMDAIGQLVGGVAHDFNNILTVIRGSLEFMRDDPSHTDRENYLNDAWRATSRGEALTQHLLAYGRRARLAPKKCDLNHVVMDMDPMLRRVMPAMIAIEIVAAGGLWPVRLDRHQLETALFNILNNARDSMPGGGKITIETGNMRITNEYVESRGEDIRPGRYVMLAVTDTGQGMPPEVADRVFEPYFTTKPVGRGSGLGLAMVFGFVKQSEGVVQVYSEEGFGTTFKLYFPAHGVPDEAEDEAADRPANSRVPSPLSEVLVVEDEPDVRKVLVTQLKHAGLSVAEAGSGDAAYAMLSTGYRPKVLVTDIVMPGSLQGPELARKARLLDNDLKCVFVSGYPTEAVIHGNDIDDTDCQVMKPVQRKKFVDTVTGLLGSAEAPAPAPGE